MGQGVEEWCCKLYHVGVVEKESERRTRAALRWYQFGAPWERMAVDIAGPLPCKPADVAPYRQLVDDHLGESCHRRRLRLWRRCSSAGNVQMWWATTSTLYNLCMTAIATQWRCEKSRRFAMALWRQWLRVKWVEVRPGAPLVRDG